MNQSEFPKQSTAPTPSRSRALVARRRRGAIRLACAIVLAAAGAAAQADDPARIGVALTGGLSGIGADLGVDINDYFAVRGTVAGLSFHRSGNYGTNATWNGSLKLFQAGLLLDAYPFAGRFHLSGGVVHDGNQLNLAAQPVAGSYTFNGNTYNAADVATATASVSWHKAVPYLGIGWGNLAASPGPHFTGDLGALITGSADTTVAVSCSAVGQQTGICQQLASDVAVEQGRLQNRVHGVTLWPVLRLGVGYAF